MDITKALVAILFVVGIFGGACRKKDNSSDPVISIDSMNLGYRIKSVSSQINGSENYTYNESGQLTGIVSKGNDNVETRWRTYKYDEKGNLVFHSDQKGTTASSYNFEYDEVNRFSKIQIFNDLNAADLINTITYHYDNNQNLDYYLSQNNPSTGVSDSISFNDYVNGRPTKQLVFNGTRDPYYANKYTFKYDLIMNKISAEYKHYSLPHITDGYNAEFESIINYANWRDILYPSRFSGSLENPDSQNTNNDKDWKTKNITHSGYSPTTVNKEYSDILKYNTAGLPKQVQKSIEYFRGPNVKDTLNYSYYTYQK